MQDRSGQAGHDGNRFCGIRRTSLPRSSGETILPFFRTSIGIDDKGPAGRFDPVTAADRAAEQAMRTMINRSFPEHGIIGEEFGSERADAEYVWVLDPIDGTKSFIAGMPVWGTLIALTGMGEPVFGTMHQPFMRETLFRRRRRRGLRGAERQAQPAGAALRAAVGRDPVHHQPDADERGRSRRFPEMSRSRCGSRAMAATATPIACWPPAISIW